MKDRLRTILRTSALLTALGFATALAVTGCSGASGSGSGSDTGASSSQGGASAAAGGRHRMASALATLGLSDDQKSQIRDIMKSARQQSANADPATRRANYKAAMAKVKDILTPDQRAKLAAKLGPTPGEAQPNASAQPN